MVPSWRQVMSGFQNLALDISGESSLQVVLVESEEACILPKTGVALEEARSGEGRQRLCLCLPSCSFCACCISAGNAACAKTAKNLSGRRRRPCSGTILLLRPLHNLLLARLLILNQLC